MFHREKHWCGQGLGHLFHREKHGCGQGLGHSFHREKHGCGQGLGHSFHRKKRGCGQGLGHSFQPMVTAISSPSMKAHASNLFTRFLLKIANTIIFFLCKISRFVFFQLRRRIILIFTTSIIQEIIASSKKSERSGHNSIPRSELFFVIRFLYNQLLAL